MNPNLTISMFAGILGGIGAAVTALVMGWGWLAAIGLYCVVGAVTLVLSAMIAVAVASRRGDDACAPSPSTPGAGLIIIST